MGASFPLLKIVRIETSQYDIENSIGVRERILLGNIATNVNFNGEPSYHTTVIIQLTIVTIDNINNNTQYIRFCQIRVWFFYIILYFIIQGHNIII